MVDARQGTYERAWYSPASRLHSLNISLRCSPTRSISFRQPLQCDCDDSAARQTTDRLVFQFLVCRSVTTVSLMAVL